MSADSAEAAKLQVRAVDEQGEVLPARFHLFNSAGEPVRPKQYPSWSDHFVCEGDAALELPAGSYTLEVERGPEYSRPSARFTLDESAERTVSVELNRIADLARQGWYAGDLHVHRPVEQIRLLMQAEDLHVAPVITWWNSRNLWADRSLPEQTLAHFDGRRYYDVMAGEDEREGGALLYFHLHEPLPLADSGPEYPSPMKFVALARERGRPQGSSTSGALPPWIDIEKPFWWDVPVWLAGGEVDSIGIANNHMCRSRMYENEAWGKPRDEQRLPAPRGNGFWSQEIYYHVLNSGLRVPPSAGSASGVLPNPVGYNRVYVQVGEEFTYGKWWEALRAGRSFVTNGPLLIVQADGHFPGYVFRGNTGETITIPLEAALTTLDAVPAFEIVKNGRVERAVSKADWETTGSLGSLSFDRSGWFLVRTIAKNPRTFRFASTAPFYVESGPEKHRISRRSAQFFLDWVDERAARVPDKLKDPSHLTDVLKHHDQAKVFWQKRVEAANAE